MLPIMSYHISFLFFEPETVGAPPTAIKLIEYESQNYMMNLIQTLTGQRVYEGITHSRR